VKTDYTNISYKQLKTLLAIVNTANDKTIERIGTLYQQKGQRFKTTLDFAVGIKMLNVRNGKVSRGSHINKALNSLSLIDERLKAVLVDLVLNPKNPFYKETHNYLENFTFDKTTYVYIPKTAKGDQYSGLRNFLLELGLVKYDGINKIYTIASNYLSSFAERKTDAVVHPDELKAVLNKKDKMGKAAEKVVLDYERERLMNYPELIEQIEYTASKNVLAGYDIKSWEERGKGDKKPIERFIEVKAVGGEETKFYWSRNEINKAKKYRRQYFLYLVPVISDEKFDIERMEVIRDPFAEVFNNTAWAKQAEIYSFTKAVNVI